ncbi:MAG: LysM peptidoglycan-binding domain-containing protein [Deltaproteobacteria bacterium]|nr:LysM peptidoglycan-binding domain-containing protein [Deltaproteobacteria bacterium]
MRVSRMILLVFISVCTLSILAGMAMAGEYVAKQGDTWDKVAKATGNKVEELAKMNKVKDAKGSAPVTAGTKIVFFSKEDLEDALKWAEQEKDRVSYGTEKYSVFMSAYTALKAKRIEYAADDPYPYGIRFNEALEYAKAWRSSGKK